MSYDEDEGFENGFRMNSYEEDEPVGEFSSGEEYDLEDENPERDG